MQNILTRILSGYSLSILTTVLGNQGIYKIWCKKKGCTFCQQAYGDSMHDIEIPAQNSMHTMERLVAPLNKSATFFQAPCSTKLMFGL